MKGMRCFCIFPGPPFAPKFSCIAHWDRSPVLSLGVYKRYGLWASRYRRQQPGAVAQLSCKDTLEALGCLTPEQAAMYRQLSATSWADSLGLQRPGKPAASTHVQSLTQYGLLFVVVACCFGLLGLPGGISKRLSSDIETKKGPGEVRRTYHARGRIAP